jgi:hypothetical protein
MQNVGCGNRLAAVVAVLLAMAVAGSGHALGATNYYANTFESYTNNALLVGDGDWTGVSPESLTVIEMLYTNYTGGNYPLVGPHTKVAKVDEGVTNELRTVDNANVWVDQILNPTRWDEEEYPVVPDDAQLAVFFNTNGHPVLLHSVYETPTSNTWTEIPEITVGTDEWARVTVELRYAEYDTANRSYFSLTVSGVTATNAAGRNSPTGDDGAGGPWFPLQPDAYYMKGYVLSGAAYLDDLRITDEDPFAVTNWTLSISHSSGGVVIPEGDFSVTNGGSHAVVFSNDTGYAVVRVVYDGADQDLTNNWAFTDVTTNHSLYVEFGDVSEKTIMATVTQGNGAISPSGAVVVAHSGTTNFVITPADYWTVEDVVVNSESQGPTNAWEFTDVLFNQSISVSFVPELAVGGVPHWWLNQTLGATSDFDTVAATNNDGDAFSNADEYWSSTDPNDPTSFLTISDTGSTNGINYVVWYSKAIDPDLDPFIILRSTNLAEEAGWDAAGLSNGRQPTNVWTEAAAPAEGRVFYRIGATNVPPAD